MAGQEHESNSVCVSVIVISYNTRAMTLECLHSVYAETRAASIEVIVVDNGSTDGSAEAIGNEFPQARMIASDTNLGFAAGNNLAAKQASGRYLLLLNPDTVVLNAAIDRLVAFADAHPEAGLYGGRTLYPNGQLNPPSCWRRPSIWSSLCRAVGISGAFKNSGWLNADAYGGWDRDTVRAVDIVSGCFLLIRRELWERLGGFDTSYFMYGEDWDLCFRAQRLGATCLFCPDAEIIHYGGASEPVRADKLVRLFSTKVRLYRSHWSPWRAWLLVAMLKLWALRGYVTGRIAAMLGRRQGTEATAWGEVWRRRGEWAGPNIRPGAGL